MLLSKNANLLFSLILILLISNISCENITGIIEPKCRNDSIKYSIIANMSEFLEKEKDTKEKYYDSSTVLYDFDYEKKQLRIGFKYWSDDYDKIVFSKRDGDLYIVESESLKSQNILMFIGKNLSILYDEFMKYYDFKRLSTYKTKPLNSNFNVAISQYGVGIYVNSILSKDFKLSSYCFKNEYDYECNSTFVLSALQGKEAEIFKRIFVRIDDCPEWSRQALYQIRQNQLEEEKKLEEKQLYAERKKQRILKIKKLFFPW